MKNKKIPFHEDYNMSKITIDNSSSVTECTGLTPFAQQSDFEHKAYSEIVEFFPEDIVEKKQA